jgi:tripartite-type tricarboxylate transporter receptor subunit TctC
LPDIPTLREKGWNVVVPKFRGLVFNNYLKRGMIEPYFLVGEGFEELIREQVGTFGGVMKKLGF